MANIALVAKHKAWDGENVYDIIYNTGIIRKVVGDANLPKTAASFIRRAAHANQIWNRTHKHWETVYK